MLVKNIILKVCDFIENAELARAIEEGDVLTAEQQELQDKLVKCFNLVLNEIASEYLPMVKVEKVKAKGDMIEFSKLNLRPCDIVYVKDSLGGNVQFRVFDQFLLIDKQDCEVEVCYNAYPNDLSFYQEIDTKLSERVYAYGIVREYYFIQTLYEDAKVWDERFKNALAAADRKKGETVLPRRRWI